MPELDPRLGHDVDGRRVYPAHNLNGQPYSRNGCSTLELGDGFFVVLPAFYNPRHSAAAAAALEALRASLDPNAPPVDDVKPAPKKGK